MRTIPHRELRNDSSKVLADVKAGETIAVTNNGEIDLLLPRRARRHHARF